jgi:hypothetical protein
MRGLRACVIITAFVLAYAVAPTGAAMMSADLKKELTTAMYHASELAQRGDSVATSKLHVQHVINCLEGPNGADFKATAGYPCQGQGNGAIPDLNDAAAAKVAGADVALKEAKLALKLAVDAMTMTTVTEVQPWARVTAQHLNAALNALGG